MKNQKGITLIALAITIIVLIILAGVTMNLTLGEDGLINRAKKAVEEYREAQEAEKDALQDIERQFDNIIQSTDGTFTLQVMPENENWAQTKVVSATTDLLGYEIKMKIDGGEYETRNSIEVDRETIVYAILWDSIYDVAYGEELQIEVVRVGTAEYTVNHYLENVDGTYGEANETETLVGNVRTEVAPTTKQYEGFTSPEVETKIVDKDGNTVINYKYTRNSYNVTLNKGKGIESVTGDGTYKYGQEVTITATEASGYSWKEWTGEYNSTDISYTFTMPAMDIVQTANSNVNSYTVTVNKGIGIESVSGAGTYEFGEEVTITATVASGYSWSKWTGTKETTTQTYTFTMPAENISQTANATVNQYKVTLNKGTGIASVSGAGTYDYGESVTITATLSTGYSWSKWTGTKESTTQTYTFKMPAENVTQTASATANSYTLSFNSMGGSSVASKTVKCNAQYGTLSAPTWTGYTFNGWYTAKTGGTKVSSTTKMGAANTTVYAQWTKNSVAKGDAVLDYGTVKNWYVISVSGDNIKIVSKSNVGTWTETKEAPATEVSKINSACTSYTVKNSGGTVRATCSGNLTLADVNSYDGASYSLDKTVSGSIFKSGTFWLATNCTEKYGGPYWLNAGLVKYAYYNDGYVDTFGLRPVATITKSNLKWNSENKYWIVN